MIAMLALFLSLLSGSALCCAFCGRRSERTLPLTLFGILLVLYVFGLFDALRAGACCVGALALLCWLVALGRLIQTRGWAGFARSFFTPALCIYAGLFLLCCLCNLGRKVSAWDDLTHWADVVKQMSFLHKFSASAEATALFPNYPPAMALLQYYAQMLASGFRAGAFTEWLLFPCYSAAMYALFMPFLSKLCYRRWFTNLCVFAAIFLLPGVLLRSQFRMLQIDAFVGVLAGFGLAGAALFKLDDPADMLSCALSALVLTLSKDSGLFFAVMVVLALLLAALVHKRFPWQAAAAAAATALARLSWFGYMQLNRTPRTFSEPVELDTLMLLLRGRAGGHKQLVWDSFGPKLFEPIYPIGILEIWMSTAALFLLLLGVAVLMYLLLKRSMERRTPCLWAFGFTAILLYMLGMCIIYPFKFPADQAVLTSFDRYMATALLMQATLLFLSGVALMEQGRPKSKLVAALLVALLLACAPAQEAGSFVLGRNRAYSADLRAPADSTVEKIRPLLGEDARRIYIVAGDDDGTVYLMLRFMLYPHQVAGAWYEPLTLTDAEQWRARLIDEHFDYVLVYRVNEYFLTEFAPLFGGLPICEDTLYAVDPVTGGLTSAA